MLPVIERKIRKGLYPQVNPPCSGCAICPDKIKRGQALCPILDQDIIEKRIQK